MNQLLHLATSPAANLMPLVVGIISLLLIGLILRARRN